MSNQKYMWLGTLNNPDVTVAEDYLKKWFDAGALFVCGQVEKGESGTVHLQYYVHWPSPGKRLTAMKKFCSRSHFEPVTKNNGADAYCMKEETRVDGPWSFGVRPAQVNKKGDKARRNMEIVAMGAGQAAKEGLIGLNQVAQIERGVQIVRQQTMPPFAPTHDRGVWIYGPSRTGKSTWARKHYPDAYDKLQNKWWCGYNGEKNVILDDLDTDTLGHYLKRWMDVHPCKAEYKGGSLNCQHEWFIVTSNQSIEDLFAAKPEMIKPIQERCEGRVHHFTKRYKYGDQTD